MYTLSNSEIELLISFLSTAQNIPLDSELLNLRTRLQIVHTLEEHSFNPTFNLGQGARLPTPEDELQFQVGLIISFFNESL